MVARIRIGEDASAPRRRRAPALRPFLPAGLRPLFLLAALVLGLGAPTVPAAAQTPAEYRIKAAFLFNFIKFVDWPAPQDSAASIVIGVFGADPFGSDLDETVRGKTVRGRPIIVRRFREVREIGRCHILFVPRSEEAEASRLLRAARNTPTLTVGEQEEFVRSGGMVGFYLEEDRVRFRINPDVAEREGLQISSQLLKLATVVRSGGDHGER